MSKTSSARLAWRAVARSAKAIRAFVVASIEAFLLREMLDIECPHDPLNPCADCDNAARAERW